MISSISWHKVLENDMPLNVMLNVLPTKGNLVYEYNPFRNYRLTKDKYYYDGKYYTVNKQKITGKELIDYYIELINKYPIISIEDAFAENDIESIKELTKLVGDKIMLVGDDYFVT